MSSQRPANNIFRELERLDSTNHQAVVDFVEWTYCSIKASGYQEGSGNRQLIRTLVDNETIAFTRQLIQRLYQTVTTYEQIMDGSTDPYVNARVFLLSTYAVVAESVLDDKEDAVALKTMLESFTQLSKKFSLSHFQPLQWFADYVAEFISEVYPNMELTSASKIVLLKKMLHDLTLLEMLMSEILKIDSIYQPDKKAALSSSHIFVELKGMVLDCSTEVLQLVRPTHQDTDASTTPVTDALKSNAASPAHWFYRLWIQLLVCAERFTTTTKTNRFYAPKLVPLLQKNILDVANFKSHAAYCGKQLDKITKEEVIAKSKIAIGKGR